MSADPVLAGIADEAAHDLPTQLAVLTELHWSAIELRTIDRTPIAELAEDRFERVRKSLADNGFHVVCVASRIGGWARPVTAPFEDDLTEFDVLARRALLLGVPYIRIMSYPNDGLSDRDWRTRVIWRIGELARRAEDSGVILLHENCSGWAGSSAERTHDLLESVRSPALKLLFDTGNGVAHGYDGLELLGEIVPHVAHVHVKDADASGFTVPGRGVARVDECIRTLRAHHYRGAWSLEPHLSALPHEGDRLAGDAVSSFLEAGRAMAELLR